MTSNTQHFLFATKTQNAHRIQLAKNTQIPMLKTRGKRRAQKPAATQNR
jgi:hypothetical protein